MSRFLKRVWRMLHEHLLQQQNFPVHPLDTALLTPELKRVRTELHECIDKVARDVGERLNFNTAIAAMMEFINSLSKLSEQSGQASALRQEAWDALVRMLAPITPHVCHVLWQALGHSSLLLDAPYPCADKAALVRDELTYVIQINGKLRSQIILAKSTDAAAVEAAARADATIVRFVETSGLAIKKVIVVPGKLVNLVLA